jgi:HEAT repeat protein
VGHCKYHGGNVLKASFGRLENMKKHLFILGLCPVFLVMVLSSSGQSQGSDQGRAQALLTGLEKRGEGLDELLAIGNTITPLLLSRLGDKQPEVRRTALDLLGRLDLQDDGVLNRGETIDVMVKAINGSEPNDIVRDIALRYLEQIDSRKAPPSMIQALLIQLQNGHARAVRVLGRVGDPSLRPALEPYAVSPDEAVATLTRQALAKLGDQHYLAEILAELDAEDREVRSDVFRKLAYIGDKTTIRQIAQFLWNLDGPALASSGLSDIVDRFFAAWALSQIVDNPPAKKDLATLYTEQDIKTWQAWWEAHQHEYP